MSQVSSHAILNPYDVEIRLPRWALIKIRKLGLRVWNNDKRMWQISEDYFDMLDIVESPEFRPQPLRAVNWAQAGGRPRGSGRSSELLKLLGPDCSGPQVFDCACGECRNEKADRFEFQRAVETSRSIDAARVFPRNYQTSAS